MMQSAGIRRKIIIENERHVLSRVRKYIENESDSPEMRIYAVK